LPMAPLVRTPPVSERLVLIPAISKNSTTGFKNVSYDRSRKKFQVQVRDGDKRVHLGCFDTAEEAATAYARSEYGRADAAKLLQPRSALTAAGLEAIRQAEREGLTLTASSSSNSGYKGVTHYPKERSSKKYRLTVTSGGKSAYLGMFATAEEAALFYARRQAGRLAGSGASLAPPPPPPPLPTALSAACATSDSEATIADSDSEADSEATIADAPSEDEPEAGADEGSAHGLVLPPLRRLSIDGASPPSHVARSKRLSAPYPMAVSSDEDENAGRNGRPSTPPLGERVRRRASSNGRRVRRAGEVSCLDSDAPS